MQRHCCQRYGKQEKRGCFQSLVLWASSFGRSKKAYSDYCIWRGSGSAGTPHPVEVCSLFHKNSVKDNMNTKKHKLWDADARLFAFMKGKYQSVNEENFFKNMQYKQEYEVTALNDLIVSEYENDDEIYIVRMYYEEYVVGHGIDSDGAQEEHVMCLSDALSLNLKDLGFIDRDITLLQWLRERDYDVVNYERNYDLTENG